MKDYRVKLMDLHSSDTLGDVELEHLKIETRLIGESFECEMGECVI